MTEAAGPASRVAGLDGRGAAASVAAFLGLLALYVLTAPANHAQSWDAYYFADVIANGRIGDVPQPRLFLWIAAMQGLHAVGVSVGALVGADPDPFRLIGFASAVQAALAVTLFARLLMRALAMDARSAWLSAGLLGGSYGFWRYASEIEVYATAALVSVVLLLAAFATGGGAPTRLGWRVGALACLGGAATLVYQPVGLVAGVAVPFYLLVRLGLGHVVLYCAVSGAIVAAGFWAAYRLGSHAPGADAVAFVLDAERVPPVRLPDLATLPKVAYAIGHDLLSTNWSHAFEPLQSFYARACPGCSFVEDVYAAERAGWVVWVAALTLPVAAGALAAIVWTAARRPATAAFQAPEAALAVWLAAHAAMIVAMHPDGFEGWIPALVPMMALAGRRLIAPAVAAGRTGPVIVLLAAFLVHNGLAGIGVVASEDGDFVRAHGEPLIEEAGPGDLIVLAWDWKLEHFLAYAGSTPTLRAREAGIEEAGRAIDATLADGGRVLIVDDLAWAPARLLAQNPALAPEFGTLLRDRAGAAPGGPADGARWFHRVEPEGDGR